MKKTTLLLAHLLARHAWLWAALGLLATLAFGPPPAQAGVAEAWVHRYNGTWNSEDQARAVAVDGNGNVVVTGFSLTGTNSDYYTAKYAAADGALLWEQRYTSPGAYARAVAVDGSGNVLVTGISYTGTPQYGEYYTAKYAAADGALLWEKRYTGSGIGDDQANAVAVDSSDNVVVTGSSSNGPPTFENDYYTAKYAAADGALLWEKRYNGPANKDDRPQAVAVDDRGNVVVTGFSNNTNSNIDHYTAKYAAADGALLWEQRYDGPTNSLDYATAVAVDGSGNVVVTGVSANGTNHGDYYTAKYAAVNGALLWEQHYNGSANREDHAMAVAVDSSGNVVVTGYSYNGAPNYPADYYTAKYAAADGALLWEKRYDGGDDAAQAVAVDGCENVVVTGFSSSGGSGYDYYTAKYAAADGALLWEQRYNGPGNSYDVVEGSQSLALGRHGMVVITGRSFSPDSADDYATVVYRENLFVSIALITEGIRLRFTGIPGCSYTIERAPAVTGPWTTINTQTAPASGLIEYLDAIPLPGSAFYRTSAP